MVRLQDVTGLMGQRREQWSFQRMMSHKMRTPLNGLIGSLDSLLTGGDVAPDSEVGASVSQALESARRLESQVKDVLIYLDASKLSKLGTPLAVMEVGPRAIEIGRRLGIVDPTVSIAPACFGKRIALGERAADVVLSELFENALKFHPRMSPRIDLSIHLIEDDQVEITITDDGEPMSEEALIAAIRPYYQSESKMTGEVAGMGLGLSMVSEMIWEVGGKLSVGNGPKGGVRVVLRVPVRS